MPMQIGMADYRIEGQHVLSSAASRFNIQRISPTNFTLMPK
jgi:hypothetical protein